jgi:DNA-binding XRE family transcriptional regulator
MSRLLAMIDEYRDAHGQPSDASIARAIGIAPQTLNSWRKRGIKEPPKPETMHRLAAFLGKSNEELYWAIGVDTSYIIERETEIPDRASEAG